MQFFCDALDESPETRQFDMYTTGIHSLYQKQHNHFESKDIFSTSKTLFLSKQLVIRPFKVFINFIKYGKTQARIKNTKKTIYMILKY